MKNINKKTNTERVIGYGRVSSREQAFDSHALEQQIERLKTAGAKEIYQDVQSGKRDDRPALEEVMNLVRQGAVDELIITRIDRLARSLIKLRKCIEIFLETGVNLRILDQQIDLSTSQGKLMVNILGSLAEWEVDLLSERVRHGKQHRRNQKKACESYPWAYKLVNDRYALDERPFLCLLCDRPKNYLQLYNAKSERLPGLTVKQVARDCVDIFLEEKGLSRAVKAIFKKYGLIKTRAKKNGADGVFHWTPTGLRNWLINPILRGHTVYGKKLTTSEGKKITTAGWVKGTGKRRRKYRCKDCQRFFREKRMWECGCSIPGQKARCQNCPHFEQFLNSVKQKTEKLKNLSQTQLENLVDI